MLHRALCSVSDHDLCADFCARAGLGVKAYRSSYCLTNPDGLKTSNCTKMTISAETAEEAIGKMRSYVFDAEGSGLRILRQDEVPQADTEKKNLCEPYLGFSFCWFWRSCRCRDSKKIKYMLDIVAC